MERAMNLKKRGKTGPSHSHSDSSVGSASQHITHVSTTTNSRPEHVVNGLHTTASTLLRQNSGPASLGFRSGNSDVPVADFYCPLADSMEWIDGPESEPVVPPVKATGEVWAERLRQPDQMVGTRKLWKWKQSCSGSTRSGPAMVSNGWQQENHVSESRHGKAVLSLLGCASIQTSQPDLTRLTHSDSENTASDAGSSEEVNLIKVGNSCFYVPSSSLHICHIDTRLSGSGGSLENLHPDLVDSSVVNCVKDKGKLKLPNGLSIDHTLHLLHLPDIPNDSSSLSTCSTGALDMQNMVQDYGLSQNYRNENLVQDRANAGVGSSITQSDSAPLISVCVEQLISCADDGISGDFECKLTTSEPVEYVSAWHTNSHRTFETDRNDCSTCDDMDSYMTANRNDVGSHTPVENGMLLQVSGDSLLGQRASDGNLHKERSAYVCSVQSNNVWSESTASSANNYIYDATCDLDGASTSSYNFMDMSVAHASHYKYCARSKELDKVLFTNGHCDNNDDVGDFIEADIAQRVEETSSRGSRNSTSSNEEDNVLVCQEEKGETDFICTDQDQDPLSHSGGLEESEPVVGELHHPQEDDLGHDGVFFSYAPNQHPSSMPGMFRRDPRTCYGGASHERKPDNSLLDRHYPRQRGACRSDSSSIAKQSSSDSEISNLAFSDSSLLISPEVDIIGFDLLISATDVDRAVQVGEQSGTDVNGLNAERGSLRRNSSEEGFHEAQDDELGVYEASTANEAGACSFTNDLSSTSELLTNGGQMCSSSGACSDFHGLNVSLRDILPPSAAVQDDGIDEACILTYDQTLREKSKSRTRRRKECERRDNLCSMEGHQELDTGSACASSSRLTAPEQHTNNIVEEEDVCACCPGTSSDNSNPVSSLFSRLIREEESDEEADNGADSLEISLDHSRGAIAEAEVQSLLANILERKQLRDYYKFGDKLKKGKKQPEKIEKVMLWSEYEAYVLQVKQIGTSACGPTAILNILKGLAWSVKKDEVCEFIQTNLRDELAPIPEYLLSRSVAGTTAEALTEGMTEITDGAVLSRFFHFYPPREVDLLKWLTYWMKKGAVPLATLNLQKAVKGGYSIPDAWHHQMIYGVSPKGVYLTNPMELVPEQVIMEQLSSESVILVRRQDIITRHNDNCDFLKFLQQPDSRWQTMNVLGQVVNVLREEMMPKIPGYRAQVTSHVSIPAVYQAGITLYLRREAHASAELLSTPELPLASSAPSTPESISC